jgi:DUF1680 family protein
MDTVPVAANPRVAEDRGKVAVRRGPMIYCMEGIDQPQGVALADTSVVLGHARQEFRSEYKADLLDGVMVLHHRGGAYEVSSAEQALYEPANVAPRKTRPVDLTFIPYYVWANRQPSPMEVWVPYMTA